MDFSFDLDKSTINNIHQIIVPLKTSEEVDAGWRWDLGIAVSSYNNNLKDLDSREMSEIGYPKCLLSSGYPYALAALEIPSDQKVTSDFLAAQLALVYSLSTFSNINLDIRRAKAEIVTKKLEAAKLQASQCLKSLKKLNSNSRKDSE